MAGERLTIKMMGEKIVVIFHYCDRSKVPTEPTTLPLGQIETTKVMLRMDFDKFVEKKFKPLKCGGCDLKMTPDEVIFDYFKERIMGGE